MKENYEKMVINVFKKAQKNIKTNYFSILEGSSIYLTWIFVFNNSVKNSLNSILRSMFNLEFFSLILLTMTQLYKSYWYTYMYMSIYQVHAKVKIMIYKHVRHCNVWCGWKWERRWEKLDYRAQEKKIQLFLLSIILHDFIIISVLFSWIC